jgi:hypothetical protein
VAKGAVAFAVNYLGSHLSARLLAGCFVLLPGLTTDEQHDDKSDKQAEGDHLF